MYFKHIPSSVYLSENHIYNLIYSNLRFKIKQLHK